MMPKQPYSLRPTTVIHDTPSAAKRLHPKLSPRTMERWRQCGQGPRFVRVGRRIGYTDEALEEYLGASTHQHTAEGR
jgi:hypothetical protein